jgi:hypothetical protein
MTTEALSPREYHARRAEESRDERESLRFEALAEARRFVKFLLLDLSPRRPAVLRLRLVVQKALELKLLYRQLLGRFLEFLVSLE